jgi:hypothetical protein
LLVPASCARRYDNTESATRAVATMQGRQIAGRIVRVRVLRDCR